MTCRRGGNVTASAGCDDMRVREDLGPLRRRSAILLLFVLLALGILHLRLFQLQIVDGAGWRRLAENNRLRRLPLSSFRGRIYDRQGKVLAENVPTWDLLVFPEDARNLEATALFLARADIGAAAALRERLTSRRRGTLAAIVAGEDLSWEQVARVRSHRSEFPELSVVNGFRRFYPHGGTAAHAVGHLRPIWQSELELHPERNPNALVGASGVERLRDEFLFGKGGERWVVMSAVGQQLGVVREEQASSGHELSVTIDLALQEAAAAALDGAAGAVTALDPRDGAVRILYSSPTFNPNLFSGHLSPDAWETLRDDPWHPLQDRCTQGVYPPGSTIKPFLALGGLAEGLIDPRWSVNCQGAVTLFDHRFRCWRRSGHGRVTLRRSLEVSCDVYYYLLGQKLGIDRMADWLTRFGFGEATGIGLSTEASGLVGTPEWSQRVRRQPWYPGEAVSVSIGQGPLLATTLQLARAYAALANGGLLVTPYLVQGAQATQPRDLGLDPEDLAQVVEGLRRVVQGREGTARSLASLNMAGKTGTAQVVRLADDVTEDELEAHQRHHAWFVGWAPFEDPVLVVAIVVEHGGGGGAVAAPVAGKILRAVLARDNGT